MGFTIKCVGANQYIQGSQDVEGLPPVKLHECYLAGPDMFLDMSWLGEVGGLESVEMRKIYFQGGHYGKKELLQLVEGRKIALIVGCRICRLPIDGADGKPDVCPDELSFRCVLFS